MVGISVSAFEKCIEQILDMYHLLDSPLKPEAALVSIFRF